MGADIHLFMEKRRSKNDPWELDEHHVPNSDGFLTEIEMGRNYEYFGQIAGVRGDGPLFPLKGLPNDLSQELKDYFDEDGELHSKGWLSLKEWERVYKKFLKKHNRNARNYGDDILTYDPSDYRDIWDYRDDIAWCAIINHARRWIDNEKVDNLLLGTKYKPEVRFVFGFNS